MIKRHIVLAAHAALLLLAWSPLRAADPYPKSQGIDALNYSFRIDLFDETDEITGEMTLDARITAAGVKTVRLDLVNRSALLGNRGMTVSSATLDGKAARYTHANNALVFTLDSPPAINQRLRFVVRYKGIPDTGLKIALNKRGERTFFSNNWPDLGRHWLPTIDHISDKATSEFIVTAPGHYQVVSNGLLMETTDLPGARRLTHWKNSVPIAPWLYVLGVARFAVQHVDTFNGKAIETWVQAQDRDAGFYDFAVPTKDVLGFFSDYVGPFAYERLANIQSTNVSGGMEGASAIMYSESSVSGKRPANWRSVVIHEIAHQWFGNAVTEANWDDVWLSEGFATYFTLLFTEHAYGRDEFLRGLESSRKNVIANYAKDPKFTIVHNNLQNMANVTTNQTYQKGSWTLHMLHGIIGSEKFQQGIRAYYREHFNGNATTADFRRAMEEASGMELGWFFDQWLYKPGMLQLNGTWSYDSTAHQVRVTLEQVQNDGSEFVVPIDVGVYLKGQAAPTITRVQLRGRKQEFSIPAASVPDDVKLDPNHWVLMDGVFRKQM